MRKTTYILGVSALVGGIAAGCGLNNLRQIGDSYDELPTQIREAKKTECVIGLAESRLERLGSFSFNCPLEGDLEENLGKMDARYDSWRGNIISAVNRVDSLSSVRDSLMGIEGMREMRDAYEQEVGKASRRGNWTFAPGLALILVSSLSYLGIRKKMKDIS
jgi:hypothetical protein